MPGRSSPPPTAGPGRERPAAAGTSPVTWFQVVKREIISCRYPAAVSRLVYPVESVRTQSTQ